MGAPSRIGGNQTAVLMRAVSKWRPTRNGIRMMMIAQILRKLLDMCAKLKVTILEILSFMELKRLRTT